MGFIKYLIQLCREAPLAMAICALIFIVLSVLLVIAAKQYGEWEEWCVNEMGGHVDKDTRTSVGTGVGADGQPTTTTVTDTTYYCLNDDGGIIDIR